MPLGMGQGTSDRHQKNRIGERFVDPRGTRDRHTKKRSWSCSSRAVALATDHAQRSGLDAAGCDGHDVVRSQVQRWMRLALPTGAPVAELLAPLVDGVSTAALLGRGVRTHQPFGALGGSGAWPFAVRAAGARWGQPATGEAGAGCHGVALHGSTSARSCACSCSSSLRTSLGLGLEPVPSRPDPGSRDPV